MKKLLFSAIMLMAVFIANAQNFDSYSVKGANYVNAGIGLASYQKGTPFGISYEHGFTDAISGGVFVNYATYNYTNLNFKANFLYGGIRASYHFAKLLNISNDKFDPYAGVSLGYYHVSYSDLPDVAPYSSEVFFGAHIGARYMFSPGIGVYAEAGYGMAALNVGVAFKF